jgi:hypothetical protein
MLRHSNSTDSQQSAALRCKTVQQQRRAPSWNLPCWILSVCRRHVYTRLRAHVSTHLQSESKPLQSHRQQLLHSPSVGHEVLELHDKLLMWPTLQPAIHKALKMRVATVAGTSGPYHPTLQVPGSIQCNCRRSMHTVRSCRPLCILQCQPRGCHATPMSSCPPNCPAGPSSNHLHWVALWCAPSSPCTNHSTSQRGE